jgi:hypothetical protein
MKMHPEERNHTDFFYRMLQKQTALYNTMYDNYYKAKKLKGIRRVSARIHFRVALNPANTAKYYYSAGTWTPTRGGEVS